MNNIFNILYELYLDELYNLNIGRMFNYKKLNYMWELIQIIDFLENGDPTDREIKYLLDYYG